MWISRINGLEPDKGLSNCGSLKGYEDALKVYAESYEENRDLIEKNYIDGDISVYTVKVHALKSSSRIIGASETGALAEKLEQAGNDKNIEIITELTPMLLSQYKQLVTAIREATAASDGDPVKEPISPEKLKEAYDTMREIAGMFDYDSMIIVMDSIEEYSLPEKDIRLFTKLREAVRMVDWNEINDILEEAEDAQ